MRFYQSKTDLYLENTAIENLFIYEYMIPAKGDDVKIYLLARMYAQRDEPVSNDELAKELGLSLGDVLNAWDYWESKKVIIKRFHSKSKKDFDIEFVSLKNLMFGSGRSPAEKGELKKLNASSASPALLNLLSQLEQLSGRTLSGKEFHDVKLWTEDWGMEPEVILQACRQCDKNKKRGDHAYLSAIVRSWYEKGLFDLNTLESYLEENDKRHNLYKRIFRALGFRGRYPSEEEARIMDIWFDEYLFDISTILDACKKTAGISSPSISYIHAVLKSWYEEGKAPSGKGPAGSAKKRQLSDIMRSYESLREENKKKHQQRLKDIYHAFPRISEIDLDIKELNPKMLQMLLGGQSRTSTYRTMERELADLRKEKIHILTANGYPEDYLDPIYACKKCKDTGFLDNGEKCVCFLEKMNADQ